MHRLSKAALATAVLAAPLIALPLIGANAGADMNFSVNPHNGARSATVTIASVDPCPSGTTQAHVLAISHPGAADENVEHTDFPVTVNPDGSWTTSLAYFADGPTGAWQIQAGCGNPTDQSNNYTPVDFTVNATTWFQKGYAPKAAASPTPSPTPNKTEAPADPVEVQAALTG